MNNGEWVESVMPNGMQGLVSAIGEATDSVPAGAKAPTVEACSAVTDWADEARLLPKPEDNALATAWGDFIEAGETFGELACPSGDPDVLLDAQRDVQLAINEMKAAVIAL